MRKKFGLVVAAVALFAVANVRGRAASADDKGPEDFRVEVTGSAWLPDTRGTVQSNGAVVDLVTDLAVEQRPTTFYGRLVVKPARKHRIVVEGSPFGVSGANDITRTIVYRNRTFTFNDRVLSDFNVDYLFAGYQYDFLSGHAGHLGASVGGAYFNFSGAITSTTAGYTGSGSRPFGMPLAGIEGRLFPIPRHRIFTIEGGVRGMGVGDYGHYVEGSASGGLSFGAFTLLAGYRTVVIDLHTTNALPDGLNLHLHGPIFSGEWRF